MCMDHKSLEKRVTELEGLLGEAKEEARYFQKLAEETWKRMLREINQSSELISVHGRVEAALQESNDKPYNLFDLSPLAIAITD